jgi:hypothetical protein
MPCQQTFDYHPYAAKSILMYVHGSHRKSYNTAYVFYHIAHIKKVMFEYFSYFGSMITNDARCTREIKSRIVTVKAAFNKEKNLFTSKLDLNLRKKLVKCYIWSIALYGSVYVRWRSWLRHCATNRNVTGSIGIFH